LRLQDGDGLIDNNTARCGINGDAGPPVIKTFGYEDKVAGAGISMAS